MRKENRQALTSQRDCGTLWSLKFMEEFNNMLGSSTLPRLQFVGLIPLIFSGLLFFTAWQSLAAAWFSGEQDNSHALPAFLVALVVAVTSGFSISSSKAWKYLASILLSFTLVTYFITTVVNIELASQLLMVAGLFCLIFLFFGHSKALNSFYILALIFMSMPIWDVLLEPLVNLASAVVTLLVGYLNITVLIEGNSISTPFGRIIIAEGCSGIRYLMVSLILAVLVSHLNNYRLRGFLSAFLIGLLLGLFANWIRIIVLVLIGYYSQLQSPLMRDHELFGWLVFAVFVLPLMYYAPHGKANQNSKLMKSNTANFKTLGFLLFMVLTINISLWFAAEGYRQTNSLRINPLASWQTATPTPLMQSLPKMQMDTLTWYKESSNETFIGAMINRKNSIESKLVPYMNQGLVSDFWYLEKSQNSATGKVAYQQQTLKSLLGNQRFARVQLFNTGDRWTSHYAEAKLHQIPALLTGKNHFRYYLFLTPCRFKCDLAFEDIKQQVAQVTEL